MKRLNLILATIVFLGSFLLYVRTLAPSLLYGDSAEFQTIAYTLGIGHPSGYPVYILFARLFTLMPIDSVAYRVNLFSAFCAALTVSLVYLSLRKLGAATVPALCGALIPALHPLFWKQASMAEVYTPAVAFLAFLLFSMFKWKETRQPRWLFAAGMCGGLSLGMHTMVALAGIPMLLYLLLSTSQHGDWMHAFLGVLAGWVLFLASFLSLDFLNSPAGYYNAVVRPSLSVWGMTSLDFDSPFERLFFLYFPPQFKARFFAVSPAEVRMRLTVFLEETSWIFWLAIPGFISLLIPRRNSVSHWREAILLLFAVVIFLFFGVTYDVFDFYVYYIPVVLILGLFVGLGVQAIAELIASISNLPDLIPLGVSVVILIVLMQRAGDQISSSWKERMPPGLEDWEVYLYQFPETRLLQAQQTVSGIEDNAILFTDWDRVYSFYYVTHVLQERTSMSFHETYPQEGVTSFARSAIEYIEASIDTRPIYFSERPSALSNQFKITRAGSDLFRIERK